MKFMKWVPTVTVNVHRNCGSQKSLVTDRFDHQTFASHTYLTLAYSHTCITIPSLESLFKIKNKKNRFFEISNEFWDTAHNLLDGNT